MRRSRQQLQEAQYRFPYHHIATTDGETVYAYQCDKWGFITQIAGEEIRHIIAAAQPRYILDVGCGDGRLITDLVQDGWNPRDVYGLDYSSRAIAFARAFVPEARFDVVDIIREDIPVSADIATAIEVLEHLPRGSVSTALAKIADAIPSGGWFIATVPHTNLELLDKHEQHFTARSFTELLSSHFQVEEIRFLERHGLVFKLVMKGIGNRWWITSHPGVLKMLTSLYRRQVLYTDEAHCTRMLALCRKP